MDAALDNTNVAKVANYIRQHASGSFQFIVISLKGSLYEKGNSLVGIYRDQDVNSSRTLTLDVSCPILVSNATNHTPVDSILGLNSLRSVHLFLTYHHCIVCSPGLCNISLRWINRYTCPHQKKRNKEKGKSQLPKKSTKKYTEQYG